ncbi:1-deoxy-D-xylulose 5-phosphate reductoisomerase [Hydrobacter penzbergensis]|jgi:1-deoxy-D-xylulose-5-phosphate reductoisomerase|uniref:1-deoxy-D-xylulose 5-phosphate reductoisomerase n=1 Tax=Hydrobacter penzbergensis TaxID=1235997 RepID=A0A8X8LDY5_9BACT|nr:1-deoxy-D-xylulose-5-phosphate reductoisomerase [Hydrobacter penzbergensis]MBN8720795.1 1-deoxy-D-xylulose-5-phosphate reductoisomerase [Sediminibacterium magnilacihabitans]PQV59342.1 1-deoxy-D-xylulose 5-phosphate reductoisomerase [Sediminibacterium magnilacihabitans]SDX03781.1 1-deoxy-D-xylulose 5-phosphate reductoisomerase [Hydrobacter penzbergensis]|eukprot:jgi/Mesen1/295/ME1156365C09491
MSQKRIAIFGSTGSIGTQALDVIAANPDLFSAEILTAQTNADLLIKQALQFNPNAVVIGDEKKYEAVKEALAATDVKVFAGEGSLEEVAALDCYDMMLAGIVGYAGLRPTLKAISIGKPIALANKETLVVAGDIVMRKATEQRVAVIPVDSEHSAIFQCLVGEGRNKIERIVLTASGGPFLGKKPNYLVNVKRDHALQHPNWSMGAKITIDSATLMNKGLEMIEAKWLFNLQPDQIQVLVHPQSIVHSLVQFEDGSIKAQMGLPDMKLPIQYALAFPQRIPNQFPRYDFRKPNTLTFEEPDIKTFRNLTLATEALKKGGNMPCILNAANEIAVYAFLRNRIGFLDMTELVERTMQKIAFIEKPTLEEYFESDGEARNFAASLIHM